MYLTINQLASQVKYNQYIELGPGPGTWTKLFLEKNSTKKHVLIDVSKEMLKQAKNKLNEYNKIKYIESNFSDVQLSEKFDFFFSSRAIEYVPDKKKTIKKIYDLLAKNSAGAIITKTPHPIRDYIYDIIGRKIRIEQTGMISPKKMKKMLKVVGFTNIKIYPVIVEFPPSVKYNLPKVNKKIYELMSNKKFGLLSSLLSEAYLVTFEK